MRTWLGCGLATVMLGAGCASGATAVPPANAPGSESAPAAKDTELDEALALYEEERFGEAAKAFARAYEGDASSAALAGQAQSLQMAGDCVGAAVVYERFLEVEPDPTYTNAVQSMMDDCKAQ